MGTDTLQALLVDPASAPLVAKALVSNGSYLLEDGPVALDALTTLPASAPFVEALKTMQDGKPSALEQARLARAFALTGNPKRAAKSLRIAISAPGPVSLSVGLALAEGAAAGGDEALAVGLLDWIAAQLGEREDRPGDADRLDPVRSDPYTMCAFLERAGRAAHAVGRAMRAVVLFRTAAARYERMGRLKDARRAREGTVEALRKVGNNELGTDFAMRLRVTAKEEGLVFEEAGALDLVAELLFKSSDSGDRRKAFSCWKEAAKILAEAGDFAGALHYQLTVALMQSWSGQHADADKTLADAITAAREAGLTPEQIADASLAGGELQLQRGRLGAALSAAEGVRREAGDGSDARVRATLLAARALVDAGNAGMARKALAKCEYPLEAQELAGVSLQVRGELALVDGRPGEARALLAEAARMLVLAGAEQIAGACLLRLAGLLLEDSDRGGARRALERARALQLEPRLALESEIVETLLCEDPDELEILLEEFAERAELEGGPAHRVQVAVPKIESHLRLGDEGGALETLSAAIDVLIEIREGLPKPLRKGFAKSAYCRGVVGLGSHEALGPELQRLLG